MANRRTSFGGNLIASTLESEEVTEKKLSFEKGPGFRILLLDYVGSVALTFLLHSTGLKIAADNKINGNNTWDLALIDYFADMTLLRDGEGEFLATFSHTFARCSSFSLQYFSTSLISIQKSSVVLSSSLNYLHLRNQLSKGFLHFGRLRQRFARQIWNPLNSSFLLNVVYTSRIDSFEMETRKLLLGLADKSTGNGLGGGRNLQTFRAILLIISFIYTFFSRI